MFYKSLHTNINWETLTPQYIKDWVTLSWQKTEDVVTRTPQENGGERRR